MKRTVILLLIVLLCFPAFSGCSQDTVLSRPVTNLEFWIGENVDHVDFSGYQEKYGMMGGRQYYGSEYTAETNENGEQVDPLHCVLYTVTSYPDYSSREKHITGIYITDPNVTFYGITVNSSFEDFDASMTGQGFEITTATENRHTAEKGKFSVTLDRDGIRIRVEVSNRWKIQF